MTSLSFVKRIGEKKGYPLFFVLISALSTIAALSFFDFSFIVWFGEIFLILYFMTNKITAKKAFIVFLFYGLSFNLIFLHWFFTLHPLTWMGYTMVESLILTFLAWFSVSVFEALFYAVIGFIAFIFKPAKSYVKGFLVILVILFVEWSREFGLMGFTWGRLALSQYRNIHIIQGASIFGVLFVSFIILLVNCMLAFSIHSLSKKNTIKFIISLSAALVIFFGNLAFGYYQTSQGINNFAEINVSIVQGNVSVSDKWTDVDGETVKDKHFRLTRSVIEKYPQTDFVFWAESAIPSNLTNHPDLVKDISDLSSSIGVPLIIGAVKYDENNGLRNSIISIDEKGINQEYYKRHPVPVGEYIPFKELVYKIFPKAKDSKIASEGLVAGEDSNLIDISDHKLGALVCFDSIFPSLARDSVNDGANLLFVASNDSWYKKSVALEQLSSQSVFRALENRKYLVRAANTGISLIVTPYGEIVTDSIINEEAVLNGNVTLNDHKTIYSKTGDLFMYIMLVIFLIIIFSPLFDSKKDQYKINNRKQYHR